jgi:predicted ATPase
MSDLEFHRCFLSWFSALFAPANSIILMEQPEIHLHPSAQSILADVMIDVINSRENGADRNIQLIIETHSEHFLRRLQRRICRRAKRI